MSIAHYYEALERLTSNKPNVLEVGAYKINKDSVALEAGRKRGSIKPSREMFTDLIAAIDEAKKRYEEKSNPLNKARSKAKTKSDEAEKYKQMYLASLNREAMLIKRLDELERENTKLKTNSNIVNLK